MSKVVLGCKVSAMTKSTFIGHANKLGLGVSEYLQLLIEQELERISLALPEPKQTIKINTKKIEEAQIEEAIIDSKSELNLFISMMKIELSNQPSESG